MSTLTESQIEREQIEWVFRLTGGELSDEPVIYTDPDRNDPQTFRYTYDGCPEYAERDLNPDRDYDRDFFTAVECLLYSRAPERITIGEVEYELVATFVTSGETACPGQDEQQDHDSERLEHCDLCDADPGEDHGYIYIGDGWAELVYRAVVEA